MPSVANACFLSDFEYEWFNRRWRAVKKVKPNIRGSHLYQLFHSACTPQCHQSRERPAHQSLVNPAGGTRPRLSCALRHRLRRVHQGNRGRELDLRRSRSATSGLEGGQVDCFYQHVLARAVQQMGELLWFYANHRSIDERSKEGGGGQILNTTGFDESV